MAKGLARLFRNNIQKLKLYKLSESMILNRGSQFVVELMKELNEMLGIETKLLISFHPQTDGQIERTN